MPQASNGGIVVEYETIGEPDDVPLLLINGLGGQLVAWDPGFVQGFTDRGFFVIVFDNRDVGLSTKVEADIEVGAALLGAFSGQPIEAPYLLSDMAADAAAVLDAAGITEAHIVGISMGGMIAQTFAIEQRSRTSTLTSVMSTSGDPDVGQPDASVVPYLLDPAPHDRAAAVERQVEMFRAVGSPEHFEEDRTRATAERSFDRCYHPRGLGHQLLAILASGSRADGLRALDVPTLVIHGDQDKLVNVNGGERTAELIPGSELLILEGMGHDLPSYFWPAIVEAVTGLAAQAAAPS